MRVFRSSSGADFISMDEHIHTCRPSRKKLSDGADDAATNKNTNSDFYYWDIPLAQQLAPTERDKNTGYEHGNSNCYADKRDCDSYPV